VDGDRERHNRTRTNSGNREPVIILIHVVISFKRKFFNRVTRSPVVSQNQC
jgi:hypothetical protein